MKNPNAVAALASSQIALAGEQLLARYLNAKIGAFWEQEIMAAVTIGVLYVGRDGIKGALLKAVAVVKNIWAPTEWAPTEDVPAASK